jgi:hypothetical protein
MNVLTKQYTYVPPSGREIRNVMEDKSQTFQKVMVVPDSSDIWMVALCRTGFTSQAEAMRWALEYMNPQAPKSVVDDLFREAINDAFNDEP